MGEIKRARLQRAYDCRYFDGVSYDNDFCNRYHKRIKSEDCRYCEEYKEYERNRKQYTIKKGENKCYYLKLKQYIFQN